MRLSLVILVLFALGLGLGASAAAVMPVREDDELAEERAWRAEASRHVDVEEAQQSQLAAENRDLEAEIDGMLELLARDGREELSPEQLWQSYEEAELDAQALRRIVRRLALWSRDVSGTWPHEIRQNREWSLWVRELLADESAPNGRGE